MDAAAALAELKVLIDWTSDPALAANEVTDILDSCRRPDGAGNPITNTTDAAVWAASTAYQYGDVVTADPIAGRWWMCTNPGTSAATQPAWPDNDTIAPFSSTVTDGDVRWTDAGSEWKPTWDLNAAAAKGWRIKAGRAASRFTFTTDGQTFERAQVLAGCRQMERDYRRKIAAGL